MGALVVQPGAPGVSVLVNTAQVAEPIQQQPSATYDVVGYSPWGPTNQVGVVTSWNDYCSQYGGWDPSDNSYIDSAAWIYFNVFPGTLMQVVRVVGPEATEAALVLQDAGTGQPASWTINPGTNTEFTVTVGADTTAEQTVAGLTAATLQTAIRALASVGANNATVTLNAGVFTVTLAGTLAGASEPAGFLTATFSGGANGVVAQVYTGGAQQNTIDIEALYPSTEVDISVSVIAGTLANTVMLIIKSVFLGITETYDRCDMSAGWFQTVNQLSQLVSMTNAGSTNASPTNQPALIGFTALTGGSDDFSGITTASFIGTDDGNNHRTGLQCFNDFNFGDGQVAIPGCSALTAQVALNEHATNYNRLALIDPPFGTDKADVVGIRQNFGTWYAAIYWPWVQCYDFSGSGLTKFYPPSSFVAGACAEVDTTIGPFKAPANIVITPAIGVELTPEGLTQTDENTRAYLNQNQVNCICPLTDQGVKIYGERVMYSDPRVQMVHEIRTLNVFYYSATIGYQWAPFSVVDGQGRLFRDLIATGVAFLTLWWQAGALYGQTATNSGKATDAFIVIADSSNNPPESLANQQVHVQWGVYLSPSAEMVIINIDNVPLFEALTVLEGE
ncbi:MAG TPA: phage tail sheath subtilisin-like domain-containing protein [Blastocatellia bacterium]